MDLIWYNVTRTDTIFVTFWFESRRVQRYNLTNEHFELSIGHMHCLPLYTNNRIHRPRNACLCKWPYSNQVIFSLNLRRIYQLMLFSSEYQAINAAWVAITPLLIKYYDLFEDINQ